MLARMQQSTIALLRDDPTAIVIELAGEHDIHTAPELRERVADALSQGLPLVVDLTPATFIDSSILGVLIGAHRRLHEAGLGFAVCAGSAEEPGVRRILEVTGLIPVLPVLPDRAAALAFARVAPEPS